MFYTRFETDICPIILLGDEEGIVKLHMDVGENFRQLRLEENMIKNDKFFEEAKKQIIEYMSGERHTFYLKLNPQGTEFQKNIWNALCEIPYGETCSYKDIALAVGNDKAYRAVGMANNKNPIPLIIPCHRVVGSNGKLTGYAFGCSIKKRIIELEQRNK